VAFRKIATPYSLSETIATVLRTERGVSTKVADRNLRYFSGSKLFDRSLTSLIKCQRLVFLGDCMTSFDKAVSFGDSLLSAIRDADAYFINVEGLTTNEPRPKGVWLGREQRIEYDTLQAIAKSFPLNKTYLSVANNHAADFGEAVFKDACSRYQELGFRIFGTKDNFSVELDNGVNILTGTQWSNQPCDFIANCDDVASQAVVEGFNIMYPHWGYELELFPRLDSIRRARQYSERFDMIVGHHSHYPQANAIFQVQGEQKPCFFSLGNLVSGDIKPTFHYGHYLIVELRANSVGEMKLYSTELGCLKSKQIGSREILIDVVDHLPFSTMP